jgi:hypothetical protein
MKSRRFTQSPCRHPIVVARSFGLLGPHAHWQRVGRRYVPAGRDVRGRSIRRDSEDEFDLANIGGKTGAATHAASIAGRRRRPKRLDMLGRPCKRGNVRTRGRTKAPWAGSKTYQFGRGIRFRSVQRTGRRLVGELADGIGDPAPDGGAVVIVLRSELVGARGAFLERLVAVPLEHQVGGAPDVDLGYHANQVARFGSPFL